MDIGTPRNQPPLILLLRQEYTIFRATHASNRTLRPSSPIAVAFECDYHYRFDIDHRPFVTVALSRHMAANLEQGSSAPYLDHISSLQALWS
jgi:hypothetical protein